MCFQNSTTGPIDVRGHQITRFGIVEGGDELFALAGRKPRLFGFDSRSVDAYLSDRTVSGLLTPAF